MCGFPCDYFSYQGKHHANLLGILLVENGEARGRVKHHWIIGEERPQFVNILIAEFDAEIVHGGLEIALCCGTLIPHPPGQHHADVLGNNANLLINYI